MSYTSIPPSLPKKGLQVFKHSSKLTIPTKAVNKPNVISESTLFTMYQPIVNENGQIIGYEGLIRGDGANEVIKLFTNPTEANRDKIVDLDQTCKQLALEYYEGKQTLFIY